MKELGNAKVFSENLKRYMSLYDETGKDIARSIGVSPAAISYWLSGKKYPAIDKIELLAEHFHIQKSDLIEERRKEKIDPQTIEARIISVGVDKMTPENREKALSVMRAMFAEFSDYFNDDEENDDDDT